MASPNGREGNEPQDLTDRRPPHLHRPVPRPALPRDARMAPTDPTHYTHSSGIDQLSTAAACGDLAQVQQLLNNGVSVNQRNMYGRTPLQVMRLSQPDIAEALLKAGADSNVCDRSPRKASKDTLLTPLHDACRQGFFPTVICLVQHGANVEARDAWGNTPAHLAATAGNTDIVRYLSQGQDVARCENNYTLTPLDYLRQRHPDNPELIKWIKQMNNSPPSLTRLSCASIRRIMGSAKLVQYRSLPIPANLQDKVMLQDSKVRRDSQTKQYTMS